jgi:hemerythrin-like metal-binding protein
MLAGLLNRIESSQPYWLHESAPFICLVAGLVLAMAVDGVLAKAGGTLLILCGLRSVRRRRKHRGPGRAGKRNDATLDALAWDQSHASGHELIDAEHRELFAAGHQLASVAADGPAAVVDPLIRELIRKIEGHYHREEKILQQLCPARAHARQREHHALSARTHALHQSYLAGRARRHELIDFVVHEALVGHVKQDQATLTPSN